MGGQPWFAESNRCCVDGGLGGHRASQSQRLGRAAGTALSSSAAVLMRLCWARASFRERRDLQMLVEGTKTQSFRLSHKYIKLSQPT